MAWPVQREMRPNSGGMTRHQGKVRLMEARPHLPLRPGNERLNDRPTVIIQQVHLINDEQAHGSRHAAA